MNISDERHCQELESLGSIFMPIMKDAFSSNDFVETDIMLNWVNIIGEEISSYCTPINIKYNPKSNQRVINVEVPESGKVEDVKISSQSEGYYAVVGDWYKVADKDEKIFDREDAAEVLEKGCMYVAPIKIYTRIGYSFIPMNNSDFIKVEYNGANSVHDNGIFNGMTFDGADYIYDHIYIVVD